MADPRFHRARGPFTLAMLSGVCGARIADPADAGRSLRDVAPLELAQADQVSFLDNRKYLDAFSHSRAGVCIIREGDRSRAPAGMALLISDAPYRDYALVARTFYPDPPIRGAIAPSAVVDPSARLAAGCEIAPGAVVGANTEIGEGTWLGPGVVIGEGVVVGRDCRIHANVTLSHCIVGARVTVFPGARIGQDGFGFAPDPRGHVTVPQLGRVLIHDDVRIGANTTIDRGAGPDTVIGAGCRIDNLVQIGHNVVLGRGCIVVAQAGIAGSTRLGDFVVLGGQAGLTGHLTIGAGAQVAAQAGVMDDVPPGAIYGGSPAIPARDWHRQTVAVRKLVKKERGDG
jgi:UDP-3-O-[3-hydroxymyristoyl] glucosamine N-acyltransferase